MHQLGEGLWLVQLGHVSCEDVCRPEQDAMVIISYVAERREVGMEGDNKGDSEFGGIVVGFLFQGRGSGNRASSVNGLLIFS